MSVVTASWRGQGSQPTGQWRSETLAAHILKVANTKSIHLFMDNNTDKTFHPVNKLRKTTYIPCLVHLLKDVSQLRVLVT